MTAPNELNTEIRKRLDKELRTRQFTRENFNDIADRLGKTRKSIYNCLYELHQYGLIEIIKSTPQPTGGGPIKTYRVVKGATFNFRKSANVKNEIREKIKSIEHEREIACSRLVKAMDKFVPIDTCIKLKKKR